MPDVSKKAAIISKSLAKKKLCPHRGHDEFEAVSTRFSWLFGQRFLCGKCKGTFLRASLVKVNQKDKQFRTQETGHFRSRRGRQHK